MTNKPITQYTKSGRINIAYQVFGSGKFDLVYIPGWVSNIDLMWDCPQLADFLLELGKHTRVILFDKRGTGLSDRITELSSLEERMDDVRAVMDAVDSKKAILFGHSEGGSVSALFSATYPDRTLALITFGVFAKRKWSKDYPWAPTDEERQKVYDMIENHWGSGEMDLISLAPSMKDDQIFMDWVARYFRSGASPSAALVLTKMNTEVDIIGILDTIEVPTLLIYRRDDIDVKVEEGRFIAQRIKGSRLLVLPGCDHLFWAGDSQTVLHEMIKFMFEDHRPKGYDRVLATILKIKIESLRNKGAVFGAAAVEEIQQQIDPLLSNKIQQFRGKKTKTDSGEVTATFDGPSKAVNCAIEIRNALGQLGLTVYQGVHIGECILSKDNALSGRALGVASDLVTKALPNEIIITHTVNNLLSGAGLEFRPHGHLKTDQKIIQTLLLNEHTEAVLEQASYEANTLVSTLLTQNHSLLEDVLQSIENHLDDEQYGVQELCKEVGLSIRQLQRKLKAITNKSPSQLVRTVRLHKAKELILQKDKNISEAAFMTGFSSVSYFTKCFKKEFGQSPSRLN